MFHDLLNIFPADSSAITITTTVWIGVLVAVTFHQRLGWNLSAMVVPGYLVPLLISRPATAVVIFLEAIITYLLARAISDGFSGTRYWSSFFGRDRFFLIVVISVIVRATCDGWLLPMAGRYIVDDLGWNFDYRNELQSFGLIMVALIANYFWKPRLLHGLLPITICIATTWLAVLLVAAVTNLNLSNFHLMYADISTSLLASPKSYVILITTALLASWINLRYAWDFNGILIPALLAMTLQDPSKIVSTFLECMLIYSLASMLLNAPLIRDIAIQGGGKLLFFFTVCFVVRLILSHVLPLFQHGWEVSDAFGVGYLLSTLMAVKAHDRKLMVRLLKGTLQVTLVGGIAGSLFGFCLLNAGASARELPALALLGNTQSATTIFSQQSVTQIVRASKPLLYQKHESGSYRTPAYSDLAIFRSAMNDLKRLSPGFSHEQLADVTDKLASVNYSVTNLSNERIFLKENAPAHGWGMYVVNPAQKDGICFEVPAPLEETATLEAALVLSQSFQTAGIAIAGARRHTNVDGSADVTQNRSTMFAVFHSVFGDQQTVQLRASSPSRGSQRGACLYLQSDLPPALKLEALKSLTGEFDIQWNNSPFANRVTRSEAFAELAIPRTLREKFKVFAIANAAAIQQIHSDRPEKEHITQSRSMPLFVPKRSLQTFFKETQDNILGKGSDTYVPATMEDMLFMDNEVISPLIDFLGSIENDQSYLNQQTRPPAWLTSPVKARLDAVRSAASIQGYQLGILIDEVTGEQVIAMYERATQHEPIKGWGTYLFRPGLIEDVGVEIPRPLFEHRAFDFGVSLFKRPRASVLLIAGAHPRANRDGSADVSRTANRSNLFNLVRQVLFRKFENRPYLICQARAIQAPVEYDIMIATEGGAKRFEELSPLKKTLVNRLTEDHFSVGFVDGSYDSAGYELGIMMKAAAIQVSQNKEVASLWLSPALRTKYRNQSSTNSLSAQMNACGIETHESGLIDWLEEHFHDSQPVVINRKLKSALSQYVSNFDILRLLNAVRSHPQLSFSHIIDSASGQSFLLIHRDGSVAAVMNLSGFIDSAGVKVPRLGRTAIDQFVAGRKLWLEVGQP